MSSSFSGNVVNQVQQGVELLLAKHRPDGALSVPLEVQQALYLARVL